MTTYRITYIAGKLDTSICPPAIVSAVFPAFDGWAVTLTEQFCEVVAPDGVTPADLGPLVKVEVVEPLS